MGELFNLGNLMTLVMLVLLQAVLGFDNLLYVSIESKRVPQDRQSFVRQLGIGIAIVLRIVLLFCLVKVLPSFQKSFLEVHAVGLFEAVFNVHSVIVIAGGTFIIYTATKEILHMLSIDEPGGHHEKGHRSVSTTLGWIIAMNIVFSFDSILSAIALTDNVAVMATAIIIGGLLMIWLADHVAVFLKRNRMYEVLGLFILFIVGIMLLSEGGHLAHIKLAGHPVESMAKSTFYFVVVVLVLIDIVQSRYQKKVLAERQAELKRAHAN